ncbi:Dipeptide transport ATP-binding protein DppD (TC 3.A.1.5.2) [Klebsiella pneumoniae subsp. pneumoniae ST512-K30BO]|uniref:dipeptide ABC transporter ATP-binding protein n=1 Tax=Klebsiella pneumoniae TaxID=573 RepID=UPI00026875BA|nr:dipeptide ABC transporter ATP-binding protein [Klebsiella pneumoniae]CCM95411.1 Dipeptide transport ATP-binding protein DppD (TC 3.A.1.5.2) [Klebsiella pneumoniae subsp. pneumoniae ST512-K30BO]
MSQTHETDTCEVLVVRNLNVAFRQQDAPEVQAVRQLSFSLRRGETLAIVGESGSGKSVTALALMRLLDAASSEVNSEGLWLRRRNRQVIALNEQTDAEMRRVRGADLAMIFQEPMTSLNPVFTIGEQIAESLRLHQGLGREEALRAAKKMLDQVRIPQAEEMLSRYPHQLSGGMRQRVMIAMALSCRPAVLIADEPTTALDVTIQAQILQLIAVLQKEMAMGVIFITHDMGVVADIADRVLVMYRGEAVETGSVEEIFRSPQHPYTQSLLAAVPRLGEMRGQDLPRRFPLPGHEVHAVEKVSFDLWPGETLSLVGESGCGKSTTGRALLRLVETQGGTITFDGQRIDTLAGGKLQALRRNIQFIFQDPYASLDPRQTVGDSIMEPLRVHGLLRGEAARERVAWLLKRVGLQPEHAWRYPHAFSGGQRQRICIARALALNPKVVIADESVSALDVSIRAQIINLMLDLQREMGIAFLFISHDMAVVERISHRVAVMYRGRIVEIGPRRAVFENPQHPYTRKLMAAVPVADPGHRHPQRVLLSDDVPGNIYKRGEEIASVPLQQVGPGHFVARESADVLGRT